MDSLKKMAQLADIFEQKLEKFSQIAASAQKEDIERALKAAQLWELSDTVATMLNQAGVPSDASVTIDILVDKVLNVQYLVSTLPSHPSAAKLSQLLKNAFSSKMKAALQTAKLTVADTVTANWLKF